jgi:hypothetical protein
VNPPPPAGSGTFPAAVGTQGAGLTDALAYPYYEALFDRKSRRVALGMEIPQGALAYESPYEPIPLTELEEALLLMAGTGLAGLNLADIDPSMGADALVQWTARTWPSSCSNHGTELFYTNDEGMYFLDMWNMQPEPGELATVAGKSIEQQAEVLVEMTRRAKRKLQDGRAELPSTLPGLFAFNLWNANKPGTSLFLPISNMTFEYMNLLFIYFSEGYRFTLVDERNGYQPAGLQKWIDKGRLDPTRRMGLVDIEQRVLSMQVVEQAFMCQNMNIAMQTMGLGGWTYTGFISSYVLGAMDVPGLGFRHIQPKEGPLVPVGRDGAFEALCPPYHASMSDAVDAFLEQKWGQYDHSIPKAINGSDAITDSIPRPTEETIEIAKDFCEYVYESYGRFPANLDPMYQRLACQVQHIDTDFYDAHYPPGAYTDQHANHFRRWHPEHCDEHGKPTRRTDA